LRIWRALGLATVVEHTDDAARAAYKNRTESA